MALADSMDILRKRRVPRCKIGAGEKPRLARMEEPSPVTDYCAGHEIHVAVSVSRYAVSVAQKGFRGSVDATAELH